MNSCHAGAAANDYVAAAPLDLTQFLPMAQILTSVVVSSAPGGPGDGRRLPDH